jgi:hypothetical protein
MIKHPSPHWGRNPRVSFTALAKESARWEALLSTNQPKILHDAPLRYGPLSVEGLFDASRGKKTKKLFAEKVNDLTALEFAVLVIKCGAVRTDLAAIFLRYSSEVIEAGELSGSLLRRYKYALELSGAKPSVADLLEIMPLFPMGTSRDADVSGILSEAESFVANDAEASELITRWGMDKTRFSGYYGRVACMSMVVHFPGADTNTMANLCLAEDDFEALAFMVVQGRLSPSYWLGAVSKCINTQSKIRSSARGRDPAIDNIDRCREQARAWRLLGEKIAPSDLRAACKQFADENPLSAIDIVRQSPDPLIEFDAWVHWTLGWVANGLVAVDHPIVQEQISRAGAALDTFMSKPDEFFQGNTTLPWIHGGSELTLTWFLSIAPLLAEMDGRLRGLLATRLLLRWTDETTKLTGMGMVPKPDVQKALKEMPWLDGADVARALRLRLQYRPPENVAGAIPLSLLLQYKVRAPEVWPFAAAQIALECNRGILGVREILEALALAQPAGACGPVPAKLTKGEKVVYALTGLDTTPAVEVAKSLGIENTSHAYQVLMTDWLEQKMPCGVPPTMVDLPELRIGGAGQSIGQTK